MIEEENLRVLLINFNTQYSLWEITKFRRNYKELVYSFLIGSSTLNLFFQNPRTNNKNVDHKLCSYIECNSTTET